MPELFFASLILKGKIQQERYRSCTGAHVKNTTAALQFREEKCRAVFFFIPYPSKRL
jgi:hypothetical protein